MIIKVIMNLEIDAEAKEQVARALENHVDWVMDLDSWPEIKTVFGVKVEEESK